MRFESHETIDAAIKKTKKKCLFETDEQGFQLFRLTFSIVWLVLIVLISVAISVLIPAFVLWFFLSPVLSGSTTFCFWLLWINRFWFLLLLTALRFGLLITLFWVLGLLT